MVRQQVGAHLRLDAPRCASPLRAARRASCRPAWAARIVMPRRLPPRLRTLERPSPESRTASATDGRVADAALPRGPRGSRARARALGLEGVGGDPEARREHGVGGRHRARTAASRGRRRRAASAGRAGAARRSATGPLALDRAEADRRQRAGRRRGAGATPPRRADTCPAGVSVGRVLEVDRQAGEVRIGRAKVGLAARRAPREASRRASWRRGPSPCRPASARRGRRGPRRRSGGGRSSR